MTTGHENKIAVVGLAGRFPGADSVDALWRLLCEGRTGIEVLDDNPADTADFDDAKRAYGLVADATGFDSGFFGMAPAAARRTDPQHRAFLECVWTALESGGIDVTNYPGYVAVYASCGTNPYYQRRVFDVADLEDWAGMLDLTVKSTKDHLATAVSYRLDLKGEAMTVQSACSSSLVTVHLACQSLLMGQSDMAIAGASSLRVSPEHGRDVSDAMQRVIMRSKTGRNGAFAAGDGGVGGDAVGAVVLKRLSDAIEDGNVIYAVIAGSALNNDGRQKVGYTAPSVNGLIAVMRDALSFSALYPEEIDYIECHGTGTELGDAIELRALGRVFESEERGGVPLRIGAVKENIGHTDAAAGIASFIKAVLMLHHGAIPPHAGHDGEAHAQLTESAILKLEREYTAWSRQIGKTRRVGVNSFAIGGTNAHVVLEEAPSLEGVAEPKRPSSLLVWSAKTESALDATTEQLARHLEEHGTNLTDVERTLQLGRAELSERAFVVVSPGAAVADAVRKAERATAESVKVAFLASGTAAWPAQVVHRLCELSPAFRETVHSCRALLSEFGFDLQTWLESPSATRDGRATAAAAATQLAFAEMFRGFGIRPDTFLATGVGECVAACVGGALSTRDMLRLAHRLGERSAGSESILSGCEIREIEIPYVGSSGGWVTSSALSSAEYWSTVSEGPRAAGFHNLRQHGATAFLSIDHGSDLCAAAKIALEDSDLLIIESLANLGGVDAIWPSLSTTVGRLWIHGTRVDWKAFAPDGRMVELPTYPFEHTSFHIDDELRRIRGSSGSP